MTTRSITNSRAGGFSIGDLSHRTGVHIETIRYYERANILPPPRRTSGGRRVYDQTDVRTLTFVRRARELGFAMDDIRNLLNLGGPGEATCADVRAIATRHIGVVRSKMADLRNLEALLSETIAQCSGDAVPECAVLDVLYTPETETP